jgi:hypothetical protein
MSDQSVSFGEPCARMHSVVGGGGGGGKRGVRKQFTTEPAVGRLQVRSRFGCRMRFTDFAYACSQQVTALSSGRLCKPKNPSPGRINNPVRTQTAPQSRSSRVDLTD